MNGPFFIISLIYEMDLIVLLIKMSLFFHQESFVMFSLVCSIYIYLEIDFYTSIDISIRAVVVGKRHLWNFGNSVNAAFN